MPTRRSFLAGTASLGYLSLVGCRRDNAQAGVWKARFLELCELACQEFDKPITPFLSAYVSSTDPRTHHAPFFEDAFAVRALGVAYDVTGNKKYLDTCQHWADQLVTLQNQMIPQCAYYMNYGRPPGADRGDWHVADSGSIAMGVLTTSIRTPDAADRLRYLDSARAFADLVTKNYIGKNGGITNGLWGNYHEEWWCSTATAGALLFLLNAEPDLREYFEVALRAFDWMLRDGPREAANPRAPWNAPAIVFYTGEFYAVALHYLGKKQADAASVQIGEILEWLSKNQKGRGATSSVNYFSDTYMAGMPYLMAVLARESAEVLPTILSAAEQELLYVDGLLFKGGAPDATILQIWELMSWTMMSYAEMLYPGALFRNSNHRLVNARPRFPA